MIKLEKKNTEKGEKQKEKIQIPIWEKANLTIQEAAVYFNIGKKNYEKCLIILNVNLHYLLGINV